MKTNGLWKCFTLHYIWSKYQLTDLKLFVIDGGSIWISRNRYLYKWQNKPTISALCALYCCKEEPLGWNKLHLMIAAKINEPKDSSVHLKKSHLWKLLWQINSVHTFTSYLSKINFNITFPVSLKTPLWYLSTGPFSQNITQSSFVPTCVLHVLLISCFLIWSYYLDNIVVRLLTWWISASTVLVMNLQALERPMPGKEGK